ncbi:lysophospholipid acyltransferase 1-like, partial [Ostrinia furnacalis]|uniref:lysophospholipid acyltransferase 1-like n=1 Tax=Ostrinia furnacalis TaxID=93504 RepID=UPI00103F0CEB
SFDLQTDKDKQGAEPSPRRAVFYKVVGSVAAAVLYLTLAKKYSLSVLEELNDPTSEVSRSWSALYLLWYAHLCVLVVRCKYYHAWLLSEAICNNSGMGFNGYDNDGEPKWDKMSNIDVFGFEFAQNFRMGLASWNKNTNAWLRNVAYERGGAAWRTARVYALSAVWHGFYPGYYLTFFAGGIFTVAARKVQPFFIFILFYTVNYVSNAMFFCDRLGILYNFCGLFIIYCENLFIFCHLYFSVNTPLLTRHDTNTYILTHTLFISKHNHEQKQTHTYTHYHQQFQTHPHIHFQLPTQLKLYTHLHFHLCKHAFPELLHTLLLSHNAFQVTPSLPQSFSNE